MITISSVMLLQLLFLLLLIENSSQVDLSPSLHACVHATRKLSKQGDGSTRQSCMGCDPTYPTCAEGCQDLVKRVYYRCDGVCLPNGYYFDPQWDLDGCWGEVKSQVKIKVERCGCNAASSSLPFSVFLTALMAILVLAWSLS